MKEVHLDVILECAEGEHIICRLSAARQFGISHSPRAWWGIKSEGNLLVMQKSNWCLSIIASAIALIGCGKAATSDPIAEPVAATKAPEAGAKLLTLEEYSAKYKALIDETEKQRVSMDPKASRQYNEHEWHTIKQKIYLGLKGLQPPAELTEVHAALLDYAKSDLAGMDQLSAADVANDQARVKAVMAENLKRFDAYSAKIDKLLAKAGYDWGTWSADHEFKKIES